MQYEIRGIYAAAYGRGKLGPRDDQACLTHAVELDAQGKAVRVLCSRVRLENTMDDTCAPDYQLNTGSPSCTVCARRLQKALRVS